MNSPITISCIWTDLEKHIVLLTKRLIRVRSVRCLRSSQGFSNPGAEFALRGALSMESNQHNLRTATVKSERDLCELESLDPAHRPWWRWALPWLSRGPQIAPRQSHLLSVLGAANLVDNYDIAILGLALPQIQLGLGLADDQLGA